MKPGKILSIITFCLLAICFVSKAGAEVVAKVDRTRLAVDETLTLTVTRDGSSFLTEPDFGLLTKDFVVRGSSQSSNTQIINGSMTSTTSWILVLAPKRVGNLVIPALTVDKERTKPINIQIDKVAQAKTRTDGSTMFIESDLDVEKVYVQSQLIYSLRVYSAVEAQIHDPGDLVLDDALVERLGDATYKKTVSGRQYSVFERKYAVYPQKSGLFTIPGMIVDAVVKLPQRKSNFFDPFGNNSKQVRLRGESTEAMVMEKPLGYPDNAEWLPADSLVVLVQWSHDPLDLKVGESVTVTITTTAKELLGEQLPGITIGPIEKIKLYQNKPEKNNTKDDQGVTGERKETIALIPTQAGEVELPEIRIPWWDKNKNIVRYAVAPLTRVKIKGQAANIGGAAVSQPQEPNQNEMPQMSIVNKTAPGSSSHMGFWVILSTVLAMAWLVTTFYLYKARRSLADAQKDILKNGSSSRKDREVNEENAFKRFSKACRNSDPAESRIAMISWAKKFWPEEDIRTLSDLERVVHDRELKILIDEMDNLLYGKNQQFGYWDGDRLRMRADELRAELRRDARKKKKSSLPELYNG